MTLTLGFPGVALDKGEGVVKRHFFFAGGRALAPGWPILSAVFAERVGLPLALS
jgi:hypothetical protein